MEAPALAQGEEVAKEEEKGKVVELVLVDWVVRLE
jgi:hypothetical protein